MTYITFLLACFAVAYVYWKLKWSLINLWLILFCSSAIGLILMPINFELGLKVTIVSLLLMIVLFFIGLIGIGVATFVAAPFIGLYYIVKNVFTK